MKTENTIPIEGVKKSYFKNGQIKEVKLYKNGLQNGPYMVYFINGVRRISANYKNGKWNGLDEKWDNNGKLIVCKSYSNGKVLAERNTT